MERTATDLGAPGWDSTYGWGLLNAEAALGGTPEPNEMPVADNQTGVTVAEDGSVVITLTGSDVDGDLLTFKVKSEPSHGILTAASLTVSPASVTYIPDPDYNGSDSFGFVVNDGKIDSAAATIGIEVTAVNDAAVAYSQTGDDAVVTDEDVPVDITLTGFDIDEDALAFTVTSEPAHGSLSGSAPNLTYEPNSGYVGPDSFQFVVNDGKVDSAEATVEITVTEVSITQTVTLSIDISTNSKRTGKSGTMVWAEAKVNVMLDGKPVNDAVVVGHWEIDMYFDNSVPFSGITDRKGNIVFKSEKESYDGLPLGFWIVIDSVQIDGEFCILDGTTSDIVFYPPIYSQ